MSTEQPAGRLVLLDDHLCGLIYTALSHSYPKDIAKADTFWKAWKAAPSEATTTQIEPRRPARDWPQS